MAEYVVGFLVDHQRELVALMRKQRPAWQCGRLNGIGGHIEAGETPDEAMVREFKEETGQDRTAWRRTVTLSGGHPTSGRGFNLFCFISFGTTAELLATKDGAVDEPIEIHPVRRLPQDTIPNLRWIVPLSLDNDALVGEVRETSGWTEPVTG